MHAILRGKRGRLDSLFDLDTVVPCMMKSHSSRDFFILNCYKFLGWLLIYSLFRMA